MGKKLIMHYKGYSAVCELKEDGHVVASVPEFDGTFAIHAARVEDVKDIFKHYVTLDKKRKARLQNENMRGA